VVLAAHDVADARVDIVDRDPKLYSTEPSRARSRVVEMDVLEARLARMTSCTTSLPRPDAQANGAVSRVPAEAALGAVPELVRPSRPPRSRFER